jgi:hypothetical protein
LSDVDVIDRADLLSGPSSTLAKFSDHGKPVRASSPEVRLRLLYGNVCGGPVRTCMPSATAVVQARARVPSAIQTQQSWQAPIRQKPARGSPENS